MAPLSHTPFNFRLSCVTEERCLTSGGMIATPTNSPFGHVHLILRTSLLELLFASHLLKPSLIA
jgi:hypothetical protein